jgi:hypothetical protein
VTRRYRTSATAEGFVYAVRADIQVGCGSCNRFSCGEDLTERWKIGYSSHPESRIGALRNGSPTPLHIVALWEAPQAFEFALHDWLERSGLRRHLEWFDIPFNVQSLLLRTADAVGEHCADWTYSTGARSNGRAMLLCDLARVHLGSGDTIESVLAYHRWRGERPESVKEWCKRSRARRSHNPGSRRMGEHLAQSRMSAIRESSYPVWTCRG